MGHSGSAAGLFPHCTEVCGMGWGGHCQHHAGAGLVLGLMGETDGLGDGSVPQSTRLAAVAGAQ